ncbi:MAG: adenylosuccinate lyase, partial [Bacteroidales bacterium]|nr:adenylosuccinate lyase [Bacteroidales bacterium]
MQNQALKAISPIDGRYAGQVVELSDYFSEYALIKYRIYVEVEYFAALCSIPLPQLKGVTDSQIEQLRDIYRNFTVENAVEIKNIEKTTNHDVKAVEYFIKGKLEKTGLLNYGEFIHFGLTSQDINNTSVPLSLMEGIREVYLPKLESVLDILIHLAKEWEEIPMLAKTHGQPASPTRVGKEINVFVVR